jgi:hypothetical protein
MSANEVLARTTVHNEIIDLDIRYDVGLNVYIQWFNEERRVLDQLDRIIAETEEQRWASTTSSQTTRTRTED